MSKIFRGFVEGIGDARRHLLFRLGRHPGSALLETKDPDLVAADLLLTSSMRKGRSGHWAMPPTLPSGLNEKYPDLVALYAAVALPEGSELADRMLRFKELVGRTQPGPLQGSALRWLIDDLCFSAVAEFGVGERGSWATHNAECRRYSEMALALYRGTAWEPLLAFCSEAALGVLDYYSDEPLSAGIHLVRATELHRKSRSLRKYHTQQLLGLACLAYGQLLLDRKNVDGAVPQLRLASRHLHVSWKSYALVFLAAAEMRAGRPRSARAAARKGLRLLPSGDARDTLEDDLKCNLADALYELGKVPEAEALLRDVVTRGVSEAKMQWARGFLEVIEKQPRRR